MSRLLSDKYKATAYLVLEPAERSYGRPKKARVASVRTNKPTIKRGQIAIKLNVTLPASVFEQFVPSVDIEVPDGAAIQPEVEIEMPGDDDAT